MMNQIFLRILQYNIRKSLKIQKSFLIDREVHKFDIIIIQKQDCNINASQMFNLTHNFFHLVRDSSSQARTCIYVNKHLKLNQWAMKIIESNICSIKLQTSNLKDEIQTLRLINIYNSCSLFIIFTEESSTISRLNELIKDDCEQLIIEDFNLHHSYWEGRRCFTYHTAMNALLNIVMNARLKLLLESDTITRETYNQLTTINLAFDSEKIQFMIHKCKMRIDLHQKSDYLSIVTKLCLRTFFVQLTTHRLWKKMNTEALNAHLRIHLLVDCSLDDKTAIDDRVAEITHVLQEIIEKSISWAKSSIQAQDFWNQICLKVVTKSWWLWVVWKLQSTLETWNDYLRYNDHKNKIIKETKRSHFRSQMHKLSNELKLIWRFAKWVRIESQLLK